MAFLFDITRTTMAEVERPACPVADLHVGTVVIGVNSGRVLQAWRWALK